MSYGKAADLLRLADMAVARFEGVSLHDITEEFGCDHRTAQRMTRAFEAAFPQAEVKDDEDRRRRWRPPRSDPRWLQAQGLRDGELVFDGDVADVDDDTFMEIYGRAISDDDLVGTEDDLT